MHKVSAATGLVVLCMALLAIPSLVLIDEIYSHTLENLDRCCLAPGNVSNVSDWVRFNICLAERSQLERVFGTFFVGVLWTGFFFVLASGAFVLHWRWVNYKKSRDRVASPGVVAVFSTIAIFTLVLSFGAASFVVLMSTDGFYDCDPFTNQMLLRNGWILCMVCAAITPFMMLHLRRLYPERKTYSNMPGSSGRVPPYVIEDNEDEETVA